jgi:hypothetical protein
MGAGHIEVENFITPKAVEWAYGRCMRAQERRDQSFADIGWRAATARDDRFLKVLEQSAEILHAASEAQTGQTRRMATVSDNYSNSAEHTETGLFKGAYQSVDMGEPHRAYEWIYGAVALLCGYNT